MNKVRWIALFCQILLFTTSISSQNWPAATGWAVAALLQLTLIKESHDT